MGSQPSELLNKIPNDAGKPRHVRRVTLTILRLAVGVALLAYLIKSGIIRPGLLPKLAANWPISVAAVALFLLDFSFMAWRLCLLLKPQGLQLPFRTSFILTLVSMFFATFLPGRAGGDLARLYYAAKGNRESRAEIATVLLLDRALGLFSLLLLPVLLAPLFREWLQARAIRILLDASAAAGFGMFVAFILFLLTPSLPDRLEKGPLRFLLWHGILRRCAGAIYTYRNNPGNLVAALMIAILDNFMVIFVTALAVIVLDPSGLSAKLCLVVPMGEIANSLPVTPGGIGVGEAAFEALFKTVGLRGGAEAIFCWRIWNAAAGGLGLPFYLRGFSARMAAGQSLSDDSAIGKVPPVIA